MLCSDDHADAIAKIVVRTAVNRKQAIVAKMLVDVDLICKHRFVVSAMLHVSGCLQFKPVKHVGVSRPAAEKVVEVWFDCVAKGAEALVVLSQPGSMGRDLKLAIRRDVIKAIGVRAE